MVHLTLHKNISQKGSDSRFQYQAGVIASLPLEDKQIKGPSRLLRLTNRYAVSEDAYFKVISEALKRFKPVDTHPER